MPFEHGVGHAHAVNVPAIGVVDDRGDGVFDRELSLFGNDLSNATALFEVAGGARLPTPDFGPALLRPSAHAANRRVRRLSAYSTVFS